MKVGVDCMAGRSFGHGKKIGHLKGAINGCKCVAFMGCGVGPGKCISHNVASMTGLVMGSGVGQRECLSVFPEVN